jgi:ATP-binding protein involved in chromosome partitioning
VFKSKEKTRKRLADAVNRALNSPHWVESITIDADNCAIIVVQADPSDPEAAEKRKLDIEAAVSGVTGVNSVKIVLTAQRSGAMPGGPNTPQTPSAPPAPGTTRIRKGARLSDAAMEQGAPTTSQIPNIPGIPRILVVASAKGGVGKSTVAVNLAAAMAKAGMKVGLLDADIYGPSIPTMLGQTDAQPDTGPDGKLIPVNAHGLKTLSIGYLSDPDAPMIWRGPIVMSAITQMLNDANWASPDDPLDLLIIDTPPGTGDAQLAIAQKVPVTAALIVTTPQEVALADVRRGAAMFAKTAVPVLGIIETMSWFEGPDGTRHHIMGQGGGAAMAAQLGLPLLAELPMLQAIREGGDSGHPAALSDGPAADLFMALAKTTAEALDTLQTKPAPEIVFVD